jgi:fibronectin type 3 domain-containing protein
MIMKNLYKIYIAVTFFLLCFLSVGQDAHSQTITRGPYLQLGTQDSMVIRWRTDQPTDSVVHYGTAPDDLVSTTTLATVKTDHAVTLNGLAPDTRYYYAVGSTATTLQGGDSSHTFVTSPISGTPKLTRIWVIGDSGTANANAAAVRDAYQTFSGSQEADLWLMLGDNAYPDGTDDQYQSAVFDMYPSLLRQTVLWPTLGNHDGHTADSATQSGAYYDIFTLPTGAEAGGLASGTEAYYAFDYGNIHFISLESYETDRSSTGAMMTWLQNDLMMTDKDRIIEFWHHPPYSKGSHDSDTESRLVEMRQNALPILESYGVDLVLSGHSHAYERSFLLDGHYGTSSTLTPSMVLDGGDGREHGTGVYTKSAGLIANDGAVYAVAGSSGKTSGGSLNHPAMFISLNSLGSMVLEIADNRLDATFINGSGAVLDTFSIVKGPDTLPPALSGVSAIDSTTVSVAFSERVDATSAQTVANYMIDNGVSVMQAVRQPDNKTVLLTTSALTEGISYTLSINNIQDIAGNAVAPNTQGPFTLVTVVTKSFQDGVAPTSSYDGTRDVYLSQNAPTTNFGTSTALLVDGDDPSGSGNDLSTLIAWDVSDIPPDALIESATITLNVTNPSSGTYLINDMARAWDETQATWNLAVSGNAWQVPGAMGESDRSSTMLGLIAASATGSYTVPLNTDGLALLQGWVAGSQPNFGLILSSPNSTDGLDFISSDASSLSSRPKLTVTYSLPPSGSDITPPTVPQNLSVQGTSTNTVSLAWETATDDVGVIGYKLYRNNQMVDTITSPAYDDNGLTPGTTYAYVVTAFDAANNESVASNEVLGSTDALPTPAVHAEDVSMQLGSAGKNRLFATARVTVHDAAAQPMANATVSGEWTGLISEAVESSDCIDTTGASCTSGPGGPPTPTGLTANGGVSDIALDWDDSPVPNVNAYQVYRRTNSGGDYAPLANAVSSDHTDATALQGITYQYVVTAIDDNGVESGFSSPASGAVGDPPSMVIHVDAIAVEVLPNRKHWLASATVDVVDQNDSSVANAQVTGEWTFTPVGGAALILGPATGSTDGTGRITLISPKQRASSGDVFRFTLNDLIYTEAAHDAAASVLEGESAVP